MEENKLTNSEIAKAMAMYVPCDTVQGGNNFNRRLVAVGGFEDGEFLYGKLKNKASVSIQFVQNFQLLLTPLAGITDEHAIEVAMTIFPNMSNKNKDNLRFIGYGAITTTGELPANIFQYLISKEYAVPLWFGISHWANGKTAIELGIAIDKTLNK